MTKNKTHQNRIREDVFARKISAASSVVLIQRELYILTKSLNGFTSNGISFFKRVPFLNEIFGLNRQKPEKGQKISHKKAEMGY